MWSATKPCKGLKLDLLPERAEVLSSFRLFLGLLSYTLMSAGFKQSASSATILLMVCSGAINSKGGMGSFDTESFGTNMD